VRHHHVPGGNRIHYLFKGHQIPSGSEENSSLVRYELCPTPMQIYEAVHKIPLSGQFPEMMRNNVNTRGHRYREGFVNAQWALGAEGSGAPMHYHNTAWSALLYGAKKWYANPSTTFTTSLSRF
jgi:hypothetical protein